MRNGSPDFERLLCLFAAGIPWMPFLNLGSAPLNTAYLFALALWGFLLLRRGRAVSIPLTPGLLLGLAVFAWFAGGAALTGSLGSGLVDLLHFANFLLVHALALAAVRSRELVDRIQRAMLLSSFAVAGFGVGLSFLVNVLGMRFLPTFMVQVLGSLLYGARGREMLVGYGADMGNWFRDDLFRTVSVFFNPMQNAEYTMFFLFLALGHVLVGSRLLGRRTLAAGTLLLALQLFVGFSRTAYFGALTGGLGFAILVVAMGIVPRRRLVQMGLFGLGAVALFSPLAGHYVYKTILSIGDMRQFSNAGRLVAMSAGILVWLHNPWLGTGFANKSAMAFGSIDLSHPNFLEALIYPHIREALLYAKAVVFGELFTQTNYHSGHLLLLAQLGLFGCALFWAWHGAWIHDAWRLARSGASPSLVALGLGFVGAWGTFFATLAIDDNFLYPKYGLNLMVLSALCGVALRLGGKAPPEPPRRADAPDLY